MGNDTYVRIKVGVASDLYYHLEHAATGLRVAMDTASHLDEYGREAELADMLTHVLLALANLPPKSDDIPF